MNEEHVNYLKKVYPELYDNDTKYGGFAIGDGWFNIINQLSQNIQHHLKWKNKDTEVVPPVIIEQIKEKFGSLRFYYQGGDDYISGLVSMAESMAGVTCETCGDVGESRNGGWIRVLCDHHEELYQSRKNNG